MGNPKFASVYAIGSNGGPLKIGIAADPQRRLVGIQTSATERLELYFAVLFWRTDALRIEREVHSELAAHRVLGEWFKVGVSTARETIDAVVARLGVDEVPHEVAHPEPVALPDPVSPAWCRAARAMLGWDQRQLAEAAGVAAITVRKFESFAKPRTAARHECSTTYLVKVALADALKRGGVELLQDSDGCHGVRLRRTP